MPWERLAFRPGDHSCNLRQRLKPSRNVCHLFLNNGMGMRSEAMAVPDGIHADPLAGCSAVAVQRLNILIE